MPDEKETRPVNLKRMDKAVYTEMLQYRIGAGLKNMEELIADMWKVYKETKKV